MLQTDKDLKIMERWGCYFICISHIAEKITGETVTAEIVMRTYAEALLSGLIKWTTFVKKPGKLLELFCHNLGWRVVVKTWWDEHDATDAYSYRIIKGRTAYGEHFVCDDSNPDPRIEILEPLTDRYFIIEQKGRI
jgi:hypothetical protein